MGNMLVLLVGLLVFSVPGLAVSDTESDGMRLHYEVRVSNPGTHRVHVTLEISDVPEDATLSLFVQSTHATRYATTMCFQSSGCRTEDLGEHISGFVARDSAGRELGVRQILHEDEDGSDYVVDERRITRGGASSIVVEYDAAIVYPTYVHAPELPNMGAYLDEAYGLINESYLFFRPDPNGSWPGGTRREIDTIDVNFDLPEGWKAVSVWAGDAASFRVESPVAFCERYLDSMGSQNALDRDGPYLGVGPYRVLSRTIGNTDVVAAVIDDPSVPAESIAELVFASVESIRGLLGDYPGDRFVHFTVSDYASSYSGEAALRHVVWAPRLKYSSAWNYRIDNEGWFLYPDEILWEWCEELGFGDFRRQTGAYWFTDGAIVNTYYKIPLETGHTTLGDYYGQYVRCLELYEMDGSHLTPLIGLALDDLVKERTNGQAEIQDVFRTLYEQQGRGAYTNEDIQDALETVAGDRFESFFREIVAPQCLPSLDSLAPYLAYPDLSVDRNDIRWRRIGEDGGELSVAVTNSGLKSGSADLLVYAGYPWRGDPLLRSIPITIPSAGREIVDVIIESWPEGAPLAATVVVDHVIPGDLDTRRMQRAIVEIQIRSAPPPPVVYSNLSIECDGEIGVDWIDRTPLLTDREGDSRGAGPDADMTAVYAFADEKYLYVRIDVAGNPSPDICYSVKLTPAGSSNYVWAHSDVGSPLFVHDLYGMEASTIRDQAVGMGEVVEMAIPREALGESRGIGILVETRRADGEWEERCDSTKEWILML